MKNKEILVFKIFLELCKTFIIVGVSFFNLNLILFIFKKCTFNDVFFSLSSSNIKIFSYKETILSVIVKFPSKKVDVIRILLYLIKLDKNKILANKASTAWTNSIRTFKIIVLLGDLNIEVEDKYISEFMTVHN